MTLFELIRFDILRHKHPRTIPEETLYRELLARVEIMTTREDCGEVFETVDYSDTDRVKHDALCSTIASRIFKDLALYGPKVSSDVMKIMIQILKTLKQTNVL